MSFQIIGEIGQVLQLVLSPGDELYIGGTVLYGSQCIYDKQKELRFNFHKWIGGSNSIRKIKNEEQQLEYVGVKKNEGKILVLDLNIYGPMFVHNQKVLAINFDHLPTFNDPKMKQFMRLKARDKNVQSFGFVQADSNTYIQKQLGPFQKIACHRESLIAFSEHIQVTVKGSTVSLCGPGFVFVSTSDIVKRHPQMGRVILWLLSIFLIEILLAGLRYEL